MDVLITHFGKYNQLDEDTIERIVSADQPSDYDPFSDEDNFILHGVGGKVIKARSVNQQKLLESAKNNDMIFCYRPSGYRKNLHWGSAGSKGFKKQTSQKNHIDPSCCGGGENLGFLPGDLKEKLDPYMQPLYDALRDMIPAEKLNSHIEKGTIQIAPLAFMRGRTLDNAFVILDEGQNTTHAQMKMFLTRMGRNAKFMITGRPWANRPPQKGDLWIKRSLVDS